MKPSIKTAVAIITAIVLISVSVPLAAQQATAGTGDQQKSPAVSVVQLSPSMNRLLLSPSTLQMLQQAENCPVSLNVQHLPDGSMIRTSHGNERPHPSGIGQWLHINIMTPTVATATLLVHGYSDKGRMTQTDSKGGPDATRTVTVTFPETANGQSTGSVWVPGLTAVDSLDLTALTYVDGKTWSAQSGHTCRVTPDPLMLISGR